MQIAQSVHAVTNPYPAVILASKTAGMWMFIASKSQCPRFGAPFIRQGKLSEAETSNINAQNAALMLKCLHLRAQMAVVMHQICMLQTRMCTTQELGR